MQELVAAINMKLDTVPLDTIQIGAAARLKYKALPEETIYEKHQEKFNMSRRFMRVPHFDYGRSDSCAAL
jgi:hypothetical protein